MVYLKWLAYLLISVPFELFAKLISPILAFFVKDDRMASGLALALPDSGQLVRWRRGT